MNILIVEDEEYQRNKLKEILKRTYVENSVGTAIFGYEALNLIEEYNPTIIILDIHLPDSNGIDILELIKKYPERYGNPYVILITSDMREEIVDQGYMAGANDFLKKPFSYSELMYKIENLESFLRKKLQSAKDDNGKKYKFKEIEIEGSSRRVFVAGEEIKLERKEYDLLSYLMKNKGKLITRREFMIEIWGSSYLGISDRALDTCMSKLKNKIPMIGEFIESSYKVGYTLKD